MKKFNLSIILFLVLFIASSCSNDIYQKKESTMLENKDREARVMELNNSKVDQKIKSQNNSKLYSDAPNLEIRFFVEQSNEYLDYIQSGLILDRLTLYSSKNREDLIWEIITNNADFAIIDISDFIKINKVEPSKMSILRVESLEEKIDFVKISLDIEKLEIELLDLTKRLSAQPNRNVEDKNSSDVEKETKYANKKNVRQYLLENANYLEYLLKEDDFSHAYSLFSKKKDVKKSMYEELKSIIEEFKDIKKTISNKNLNVLIINNDFYKQYNYNAALVIDKFDELFNFLKEDVLLDTIIYDSLLNQLETINMYLSIKYIENFKESGIKRSNILSWGITKN